MSYVEKLKQAAAGGPAPGFAPQGGLPNQSGGQVNGVPINGNVFGPAIPTDPSTGSPAQNGLPSTGPPAVGPPAPGSNTPLNQIPSNPNAPADSSSRTIEFTRPDAQLQGRPAVNGINPNLGAGFPGPQQPASNRPGQVVQPISSEPRPLQRTQPVVNRPVPGRNPPSLRQQIDASVA